MICSQCSKEFTRTHHLQKYCSKICSKKTIKEAVKKYQKSDKAKVAAKKAIKKYQLSNKGKETLKKYYNDPKKKQAKIIREKLYNQNPENRARKYLLRKKKAKIYNQKYRLSQKGKEANRRGVKKALKTSPIYKMANAVRRRLGEYLNLKGLTKTNKTFTIVGCTPAELKIHLEKQFKPGMTWWNHTPKGWHIDHIIPLASAETLEETEKLAHYTNLQPMWATENLKKSNKII
jgi:hypothetical protein